VLARTSFYTIGRNPIHRFLRNLRPVADTVTAG